MRILKINKNDSEQRVDKFLTKALPLLPVSLLYKSIRTKKIKLNRKHCEPETVLREGDELQLFLSEEFFSDSENDTYKKLVPKLNVVYEDSDMLLVNKPAGMIVHSDDKESTDTLITHIIAYLYRKNEFDPDKENSFVPALCNRIDRNTCGFVIAAKNATALRILNEKIKNREVKKEYLCAAHGIFQKKEATLRGWLTKDGDANLVTVYSEKPGFDAKEIITEYKVLDECNGLSLLNIKLITGRTHQIRAHLSSIGHPLVGDGKYGVNKSDREKGYKYQALCSYKVCFDFDSPELAGISRKTFELDKSGIPFITKLFGSSAKESASEKKPLDTEPVHKTDNKKKFYTKSGYSKSKGNVCYGKQTKQNGTGGNRHPAPHKKQQG